MDDAAPERDRDSSDRRSNVLLRKLVARDWNAGWELIWRMLNDEEITVGTPIPT